MTTIRFNAEAATADGQATPVTVDGDTVHVGRGDTASVGVWQVEIDQAGRATVTGGSTFQNTFGGDVGTVMQVGDGAELRL